LILSSSAPFRRILRQLKIGERRTPLRATGRSELPWVAKANSIPRLLLDTTVYIDELQGKLPGDVELVIRSTSLWHSSVTESELSALAGLLDPQHPHTQRALEQVFASIKRRPPHRIVNPDREVWRDAGVVAGLLARLQRYSRAEQRRVLNDALILLSAAKVGLTVLTRNVSDFDLLMQLVPHGRAVFYEI
jgi:predicted nucleic acid-binding protein